MRKITILILFVLLMANIVIAIDTDKATKINVQEPKENFLQKIISALFGKQRPLAVLPSGYQCSISATSSNKFTSSTNDMYVGNNCGQTSLVKLFACNNADCTSISKFGEDYKVNGQNPLFRGLGLSNSYIYYCHDCTLTQQCTEGWVSGTRSCVGRDVYYEYQKSDCSKQRKLRGSCFQNEVCNTGSGADCETGTLTTCLFNNVQYKVGDTIGWKCDPLRETVRLKQTVTAIGSNGFCQVESTEGQICGKTLDLKQKICSNGECVAPIEPPTPTTCLFNNVQYKVGDTLCPSGNKCDDNGFYCDPLNEIQRKQLKVTSIGSDGFCGVESSTTQCGKQFFKQLICNSGTAKCEQITPPSTCSSCGAGLFNACDITECHKLGCYVSDDDKKLLVFVNSDKCVSKVPIGKQCDMVNGTDGMHDTCITGYCKKDYVEKGFFGRLFSLFNKKPIYICSEKPEGFCKNFLWAEKLPFVSGDNSCKVGTSLIVVIIGGIGFFVYWQYYRKKGKKRKR